MLGQRPITSFDEASDSAQLAANLWEDTRDSTLRMHPWNCATKRVVLAPQAVPPAYEWPYAFTLPADWLRTLSVGEEGESPHFVMEGGTILFDQDTLKLRYIARVEDVARWDSLLIAAQTAAMAVVMAYPITKSASMVEAMQGRFNAILQQGRAINGQEDTGEEFGDSPLLAARHYR